MSKSSLSQHDSLFKKFISDIAVARDFLEVHLPHHLRERCDFSTLDMESGSFIEDDLRTQCSDMLYSMKTTTGHDGYVYCLIEHQSRPEKLMAFRLMRYAVAAMQRHLEQGNETLPVVIPLLFYHGITSPYPYSTHWLHCLADPELAESVYTQAFPLVDIATIPDDEILSHRQAALLELAGDITHLLNLWSIPKEQFRSLIYYIAEWGNTSDEEQFLQYIAATAIDYREDIMTIAEQLEAKGIQKGKQEGYQLGRQDGVHEGVQLGRQEGEHSASLKIARQLIANGVERTLVKMSTGLSDDELATLFDDGR
ncbi:Rpn family recombination-promoting nuclease/putative transposase [Candidatus Symbiopectobacterium sp.]|uniref:Rpn family recombination-promoting nuclease/putative transposase n=1 Tax=Candidatus Symbiopectobacterium sp. TaxID=2816440 RepID=UPI0025C1CD0B|nr:Rpn family recombination-promoting nuclease/putative transposase [Candidatus Symbiopectobacterium sp.]